MHLQMAEEPATPVRRCQRGLIYQQRCDVCHVGVGGHDVALGGYQEPTTRTAGTKVGCQGGKPGPFGSLKTSAGGATGTSPHGVVPGPEAWNA